MFHSYRLAAAYRRKETSNLYKVDYRSFCDEVDKGKPALQLKTSAQLISEKFTSQMQTSIEICLERHDLLEQKEPRQQPDGLLWENALTLHEMYCCMR